jgi:diaminohydroxyphosphoribosylaminopyrimidine deaminase/5-amino-6-(5-phosphoribosylamino)uracil reductase
MAQFRLPPLTSVLVEGGASVLYAFLELGRWDEARIITGDRSLGGGTPAPILLHQAARTSTCGTDHIELHVNGPSPDPSWHW